MARPTRPGLDYFNVDTKFEDNLKLIIAIHKNEGLGVMMRLWQKIYGVHGYYAEWGDDNVFLFADEISLPVDILKAIIETCFEKGIFHRGMYQKNKIITSAGIQKRWLRIVTDIKRKDCTICPEFDILLFIPVETPIIRGETPVSPGGNATKEKKGNKSKRKESKGDNTTGATSAPKVDKIDGEIWKVVVDTWFTFYESKYQDKPIFSGRDPAALKNLCRMIEKKVIAAPGHTWNVGNCAAHLTRFLQIAHSLDWLKDNFLVQNLVSQFDKIIASGKNGSAKSAKSATGEGINVQSAFDKIDRLYGQAATAGS